MQIPDGPQVFIEVLCSNAPIFPPPARGPSPEVRAKGIRARLEQAKAAYAPIIGPARVLRAEGATYQGIAEIINANGGRTRSGAPWDAGGIRRILSMQTD